ncbi:superoxide dismutase family protein [Planomonospora sp. ID91781]|uniref:superoxide dismutase family protein n=1 Tax=Planomonospora sp. ID91781 TaxID=2738135 RepID=UPI0018C37CF4|nr:superoxide dismutase family protein [Planomonospora sp. ID91781]MBG0825284.1 superoxide dismutase family protein [Planomonospora sp. ID91781]
MHRTPHLLLATVLGAGALAAGGAPAEASPEPPDLPDLPAPTGPTGRDPAPDDTVDGPPGPTGTAEQRSPDPTGTASPGAGGASGRADVKDADGRSVGTFSVEEEAGRSVVTITVKGLPDGFHGFHLHGKGVCSAESTDPVTGGPFSSAGTHLSLEEASHPDHTGDMPDLLVGRDGTGAASFVTDRFQVRQLFDGDGTAVIIHAQPDNQANIPDRYSHPEATASPGADAGAMTKGPDAVTRRGGDSGQHIACGVLTER